MGSKSAIDQLLSVVTRLANGVVFARAARITGICRLVKTAWGQQVSTQAAPSSVEFCDQQPLVRDRQFDALTGDFASHIGDFDVDGDQDPVFQLTK